MKLRKKQREFLMEKVAEGLETGEINKLAAKFKPPFKVTRQQVDYYRKTLGVKIDEIIAAGETNALVTGLSVKENRVKLLHDLAEMLRADLLENGKAWLEESKGIGSGENYERIDYETFNAAEVAQLRGVLDDIASELGDRVRKQEVTGKDGNPLIPPAPKLSDEERMHKMKALASAIAEELSKNDTSATSE